MKILVAVKRVIDYHVKVRINAEGTDVEKHNVKMAINPFDEIAVEAALQLKEQGVASDVIVMTLGDAASDETLRTALAMGADRAVRVNVAESFEPLNVAKVLSQLVKQISPEIILLGKQAIDDDCNQTGQMLAGLLGCAQGTFLSAIEKTESGLTVTREVDGGLETLRLTLPAVLTTDLRLNTPRFISLPNIMKAKQKIIDVIELDTLGLNLRKHVQCVELSSPPARKAGIKVDSVKALFLKLKEEAKVL